MKTFLSAMILFLSAAFMPAVADDFTFLHYTGYINGENDVTLTLAQRNSDGFLAGEFVIDSNKFLAIGHPNWQDPGYMCLSIYMDGLEIADIEAERIKGGLSGNYTEPAGTVEIALVQREKVPEDFVNPFIVPSIRDFKKYTEFTVTYPGGMAMDRQIILAKNGNGFDFFTNNSIAGRWGSATLEDILAGKGKPVPFKDGKIVYKDDYDIYTVEVFRNFVVASYDNVEHEQEAETSAAYAQGVYALCDSDDEFQDRWVMYFDDMGDEPWSPAEYVPMEEYVDVKAVRELLLSAELVDLRIPVDLAQASRPNIDLYFRSIAAAFPGGLLGEAFKAANGMKSADPKTEWTIDSRNGYVKALVPGIYGHEGVEMCYWKGVDGHDIVGVNFQYASVEDGDGYERNSWLTIFFMYDPQANTLRPVCCCGNDYWANWQADPDHGMFVDSESDVWSVKLPRQGKTIEFLDMNGNLKYSCEWAADIQWFAWG